MVISYIHLKPPIPASGPQAGEVEASTLGVSGGRDLLPHHKPCMPLSAQWLHKAGAWLAVDPYGGAKEYLKVVNDYDKQPTWLDRLGLLDL